VTTAAALGVGALGSLFAAAYLRARPPGGAKRWTRTNHAGDAVTLLEGPAFVLSAVAAAVAAGAGAPAVVAGLGAGALGALDDLGGNGSSKGLGGHLAAARRGELTTGAVKLVGLGATGLVTAWLLDRSDRSRPDRIPVSTASPVSAVRPVSAVSTVAAGAVVAGSANIANLLDLRPGRALKVVLLCAGPLLAGGRGTRVCTATAGAAAGAAIGALPDDLAGRSMLGDTGANSAGALIGTALVARAGLPGRLLALAVLTVLTLASERVSFTTVIESTPVLRELDALGRPPR
jgi:hypothetical protein